MTNHNTNQYLLCVPKVISPEFERLIRGFTEQTGANISMGVLDATNEVVAKEDTPLFSIIPDPQSGNMTPVAKESDLTSYQRNAALQRHERQAVTRFIGGLFTSVTRPYFQETMGRYFVYESVVMQNPRTDIVRPATSAFGIKITQMPRLLANLEEQVALRLSSQRRVRGLSQTGISFLQSYVDALPKDLVGKYKTR